MSRIENWYSIVWWSWPILFFEVSAEMKDNDIKTFKFSPFISENLFSQYENHSSYEKQFSKITFQELFFSIVYYFKNIY